MGAGRGRSNRVRNTAVSEPPKRLGELPPLEWCEIGSPNKPSITDAEFDHCMSRLTPILSSFLEGSHDLRELASKCIWGISTEDDDTFGFCSIDEETGKPLVGIHTKAVESLSDEELLFVIVHELSHIELGHLGHSVPDQDGFEIVGRMMKLATEPLVNDKVTAHGVIVPALQSLPYPTPTGVDAFGFSLNGLTRREVWDMLDGRISRSELQSRAAARGDIILPDHGWNDDVLSPSPEAREFWSSHRGEWQDLWRQEHDQLVASRSA